MKFLVTAVIGFASIAIGLYMAHKYSVASGIGYSLFGALFLMVLGALIEEHKEK